MSFKFSTQEFHSQLTVHGRAPPLTGMAQRDRKTVAHGFPITQEQLKHRYHHEVELETSEATELKSRGSYVTQLFWRLIGLCRPVPHTICTIMIVKTSSLDYGLVERPVRYPSYVRL